MSRMELRRTDTGYKFDLKAANGETVATSEVYATKAACLKGAESVLRSAPTAPAVDPEQDSVTKNPRFEVFRDRAGRFRFRLRSRNGKIIAVSEPYLTRFGAQQGVEAVRKAARAATDEKRPRGLSMLPIPRQKW